MNVVKYKPVGMNGPITRVRVTQKKRAMYGPQRRYVLSAVNREMSKRRYERAGGRFK